MTSSDSVKLDSPKGKEELALLQHTKVGDVRTSILIPAFSAELQWTCIAVEKDAWTYEGTFIGVPVFVGKIELEKAKLTLTVVPA